MCGIFGIVIGQKNELSSVDIREVTEQLFKLSQTRGKDSAGLAVCNDQSIAVLKQPVSASNFLKSADYDQFALSYLKRVNQLSLAVIGHCRMVTNGQQEVNENNHPVVTETVVGVHNGIVTNIDDLWLKFSQLTKKYDVDTEIILRLFELFYHENKSIEVAVKKIFEAMEGEASFALLPSHLPVMVLATNVGSLYFCQDSTQEIFLFASERYILEEFLQANGDKIKLSSAVVEKLPAGEALIINLDKYGLNRFNYDGATVLSGETASETEKIPRSIINLSKTGHAQSSKINNDCNYGLLEYKTELPIKRCAKCILPETFPGIIFDEAGVCNICNNYKRKEEFGQTALVEELKKYKKHKSRSGYDCLVAFSGGRDSSYGLHYIKEVLGMNPLTFTYDWGVVTDLARRNQARICGKLGAEHIIVSADIVKKRANVKKNVLTWLKKPDLGLVPLFMAGDKQFFYYANKIMKQNDINIMMFFENEKLESTKFKTGFCGVSEIDGRWANLPVSQKIKLASYYGRKFLSSPGYLNPSLFDTLFAYLSTYLIKHDYLFMYRFIEWNEQEINRILINDYNWEVATDTNSTWRIGDGTAPFYNYIYYTIAGFTENDTFRSNQIREGIIDRQTALDCIKTENKPRPDSLKWYCDTIGIDFNETIKTINSVKKLYKL